MQALQTGGGSIFGYIGTQNCPYFEICSTIIFTVRFGVLVRVFGVVVLSKSAPKTVFLLNLLFSCLGLVFNMFTTCYLDNFELLIKIIERSGDKLIFLANEYVHENESQCIYFY